MVNISGQVSINTAPAVRSLQAAARAFENVEKAGKDVTIAQRAAMTAMAKGAAALAAENRRAAESFAKIGAAAIKADRDMRNADLNASNKRKNDRAKTAADVGLIGARTDEVSARIVTNADESAAKVVLANARAATEEVRQRVALENSASIIASRSLRDQLALRAEQNRLIRQAAKDQEASARYAQREIDAANSFKVGQLHEARYVLGDLARGITVTSIALAALPVATAKIAIDWEKDFANVVRTVGVTGDAVGTLKGQFTELVTTMPVSFGELAEIGTLAGQLGIAEESIGTFTKTVAMFASATGVSIDESATAFGRLNSLVPDVQGNFTELGDAILKVGVNSVATEQSIIRITTQIAAVAAGAGFSSKEIIGLSGALASVGVPPELSRGVTTRVFGDIGKAVANGGVELEKWGATIGMTGAQFKEAWSSNASGTFLKFMDSIRQSGGGAALVLNDLGITSVRDVPILMRLAGAMDSTGKAGGLLQESINNANNSAGEMERQFGVTSGTVAAKIQVLVQNIMAIADAIGSTQLGNFGNILDTVTDGLQDMANSLDDNVKLFGLFELDMTNADMLAFAAAAAAVTAVLGLALAGIVRFAQGIVTVKVAMATMPAVLGAFGIEVGTMGTNADASSKKVTRLGTAMNGLRTSLPYIGAMFTTAAIGVTLLNDAFDAQKTSADDAAGAVANYGADVLGSLDAVVKGAGLYTDVKLFDNADELKSGLNMLEKYSGGGLLNSMDTDKLNDARTGVEELNKGYSKLISEGNGDKVIKQVGDLAKAGNLTNTELSRLIYNTDLNGYFKGLLRENGIKITEENLLALARGGLSAVGVEAEGAAGSMSEFSEELSASQEAAQASIDSLAGIVSGMLDFGSAIEGATEDGKLSITKFMETIREQAESQAQLKTNIGTLLANGISNEFLDHLTSLGPSAAPLIAEFAANPAALAEAQEIWRVGGEQSAASYASGLVAQANLVAQVGAAFGQDIANNLGTTLKTASAEQLPGIMANMQAILDTKKIYPSASFEQLSAWANVALPAEIDRQQVLLTQKKLYPNASLEEITARMNTDLPQILGENQMYLDREKLYPNASLSEVYAQIKADLPGAVARGQQILDFQKLYPKADISQADATITAFVNRQRVISIAVRATMPDLNGEVSGNGRPGAATGGAIRGPGTGTSDSIPYMLSNGEHVLTAREVQAAGGQQAIYAMRRNILSGTYGRAAGGAINNTNTQQASALRSQPTFVSSGLDANAVAAIMALSTRPVILKVDGRAIARATSDGARGLSQIGMRS